MEDLLPGEIYRPLRIMIVVEPGIDGVFRHIEGLIRFLIESGQQVFLVYSDRRAGKALPPLVETVQQQGECLNLHVAQIPEPGDVTALGRLYLFSRRIKPDIIHGHSSKAGVLSRSLSFLGLKTRFFYTPHAYFGLFPRKSFFVWFYNWVERFFASVGETINISDDEKDFAVMKLGNSPKSCISIHNPVDAQAFQPGTLQEKRAWREENGLPPDAIILGSMGRLSFQKDPQTLYRAFARLLATQPNVYLFHVGKGKLDDELKMLAESLGIEKRLLRKPYYDIPQNFYKILDGFVITSRYEAGWPIVLLEALACDLPVICTTGRGTSTIGEAGLSHCWTASVGDVQGISESMELWLQDLTKGRASNHRAIVGERFNPQECFGAVLKLYQTRVRQTDFHSEASGRLEDSPVGA